MTHPFNNGFRSIDEYSLYVNDLPEELNEDGIRKIFKQYGIITAIIAPSDAKFAFISYPTYAEAEAAIRGLNGKPPLHLQVQFRRKKGDQNNVQVAGNCNPGILGSHPTITHNQQDFRYPAKPKFHPQNTNGFSPRMHLNIPPPTISSPNFPLNQQNLYNQVAFNNNNNHQNIPLIYNQGLHTLVQPNELYASSNHLWTRGTMTIDAAERRHVTMGRGFTNYHIPEPHPRVNEFIAKALEKRQPGLYESGIDKLNNHIGNCLNCGKTAMLRCSSCQRFYCCWECQVADWQRHHATECLKIPALINSVGETISFDPQPVLNNQNYTSVFLTPPTTPSTNEINAETVIKPIAKLTDPVPTTLRRPKNLVKYKIVPEKVDEMKEEIIVEMPKKSAEKIEEIIFEMPKKSEEKIEEIIFETPKKSEEKIEEIIVETPKKSEEKFEEFLVQEMKEVQIKEKDDSPPVENVEIPSSEIKDEPKETKKKDDSENSKKIDFPGDDDMFAFQPNDFISRTSFVDCQIVVVEKPGQIFSVQRVSDADDITKLMENLNEIGDNLKKVEEPIPEKTYAIKFDVLWHRGQIVDLNPLVVDYIDYGTIERVEESDFRELGELADIPRFSRRISLPASCIKKYINLQEEALISVRMIGFNDEEDIIEVITKSEEEMNEKVEEKSVKASPKKIETPKKIEKIISEKKIKEVFHSNDDELESALDMLLIDSEIHTELCEVSGNIAVGVLLGKPLDDNFILLLDPLKDECDKIAPMHADFQPKVNDYVCFRKPDDVYWLRGRVLSIKEPMTIASVDEGIISTAEIVIPIPEKFQKLCTFAVQLKTMFGKNFPAIPGSTLTLQILSWEKERNSPHIVKAMIKEHKIQVELTNWTPWNFFKIETNLNKIIPEAPVLKNKAAVTIQSHRGISALFLRSLEPEEIERHNRLIQDVAKEAQSAENLKKIPNIDDYVLAKFIDNNFYRAQVAVIDGNDIKIVYIDYGNFEVTELSKLKKMPDTLMDYPMCIVKAILKGIKECPPTKEACEYIGILVGREEPLICTFENSINDGVILKLNSGECVNDKVNDLLTATWEKEKIVVEKKIDKPVFFIDSIEIGKLGEMGELVNSPLLEIMQPGLKYIFAPNDREIICEIMEIMPGKTKAYCDENKIYYIPRSGELCIAMFEDGNWYRGCCINPTEEPKAASIYFIDFGNVATTLHENIREMTKDFLHPAAMGCVCNVTNFVNSDGIISTKVANRLNELLIREETYQVKLIKITEDQEYEIELPEIRNILVKEKLLDA